MIGSRKRVCWQRTGEKMVLIIRRMRCESCYKIHHELPDILVPYKRYTAESIEQVVSETEFTDVVAEESTMYRWRIWFGVWAPYAVGCLTSIAMRFHFDLPVENSSDPPLSVLQAFGCKEGQSTKWLAKVVRAMANSHLWIHTRSAFLSESS